MKLYNMVVISSLFVLISCAGVVEERRGDAPFPGASYDLTEAEKGNLERLAETGDISAANRLASYFFLFDGNEEMGIHWLERAGDIGDLEARRTVVGFLKKRGGKDEARAIELEKHWGL